MSNNRKSNGEKSPFFILGYPRSGSTLFRHILNVHPNLAVVEEPMYWLTYYENISVFGDLKDDKNLIKLLKSLFSRERFKSHGLNIEINQKLINAIYPRTYSRVIDVLYTIYLEKHGKKRWGVDIPADILKIPKILELFPNAKLIFLIRDIRAIMASSIKITGDANFNYYKAGLGWIEGIEAFRKGVKNLPEHQWLIVRYEDLVSLPEVTLKEVCEFLDEPYADRLVIYHKYAEDDIKHQKSDLYLKPISTSSVDKWKKIIVNRKEIARLEFVAGKYLEEFNYKPITDYKNFNESVFNKRVYIIYHKLRAVLDILFFLKLRNKKLKRDRKLFYIRLFLRYTKKINSNFIKKMRISYLK